MGCKIAKTYKTATSASHTYSQLLSSMLDFGYTLCNREVDMKDVGMRIRVEPELREEFVDICKQQDVPAAQVIRTFMREFIQTNTTDKAQSKSQPQPLAKKTAAHGRLSTTSKRT